MKLSKDLSHLESGPQVPHLGLCVPLSPDTQAYEIPCVLPCASCSVNHSGHNCPLVVTGSTAAPDRKAEIKTDLCLGSSRQAPPLWGSQAPGGKEEGPAGSRGIGGTLDSPCLPVSLHCPGTSMRTGGLTPGNDSAPFHLRTGGSCREGLFPGPGGAVQGSTTLCITQVPRLSSAPKGPRR